MKNTFKFLRAMRSIAIIAFAAVIGFSMTACPEDGGGGPVSFGDNLELSGQVYTRSSSDFNTYIKYEGNQTLGGTGTGKIEGGKLTYQAGVPTSLYSIDNLLSNWDGYTNIGASDPSVEYAYLAITTESNGQVEKWETSAKITATSVSGTNEIVWFIYVDNAVTIYALGGIFTEDGIEMTVNNLNLSLKAGWNAINVYQKYSANLGGGSGTQSISIGNPDIKWLLF